MRRLVLQCKRHDVMRNLNRMVYMKFIFGALQPTVTISHILLIAKLTMTSFAFCHASHVYSIGENTVHRMLHIISSLLICKPLGSGRWVAGLEVKRTWKIDMLQAGHDSKSKALKPKLTGALGSVLMTTSNSEIGFKVQYLSHTQQTFLKPKTCLAQSEMDHQLYYVRATLF